jgi:hypothetical protein
MAKLKTSRKVNYSPKQPTSNGSVQHMMKGPHMKIGRPVMLKLPGAR